MTEAKDFLGFLEGKQKKKSEVTGAQEEKSSEQTEPQKQETESPEVQGDQEEKQEDQQSKAQEPQGGGEAPADSKDQDKKEVADKPKEADDSASTASTEDGADDKPEAKEEQAGEVEGEINISEALNKIKEDKTDQEPLKEEAKQDDDQWRKFFDTKEEYEKFRLNKELQRNGIDITPDDLENMSAKDLILKKMISEYGRYGDKEAAIQKLMRKYDIEDEEELFKDKYVIAEEAAAADKYFRDKFNKIQESLNTDIQSTQETKQQKEVQDGQKSDNQKDVFQENLKHWKEIGDEVIKDNSIKKIKQQIGEGTFEYTMDDSYVKKMPEMIKNIADYQKLELTEENLGKVIRAIKDQYFLENKSSIIKAAVDTELSRVKEAAERERDNPKVNTTERTQPKKGGRTFSNYMNV